MARSKSVLKREAVQARPRTSLVEALAFPALMGETFVPAVGDLVWNFGSVGRVVAPLDPLRGLLVRWMPGQGFAPGDRCFVDPAKCRPVR